MRAIADLVMPRICVCCGKELALHEEHLCSSCLGDFPLCRFGRLRLNPMSESFNALLQELDGGHYFPFSFALALFFYRGDYRNITRSLKYRRNFGAGGMAATMLAEALASSPFYKDVDMVVPVPLHRFRKWRRGYNQAETVAKAICRRLDAPLETALLSRRRSTRSQTSLDKSRRLDNVLKAFKVRRRRLGKLWRREDDSRSGEAFRGPGHILLVDDVFTTGATLSACCHALRNALRELFPGKEGSIRISVATLAYVEH